MRAKKGDTIAQQDVDNRRFHDFDMELESLSMSLQTQLSQHQETSLHRLRSHTIEHEIKNIVHNGLDKLIKKFCDDFEFYNVHTNQTCKNVLNKLNEKSYNILSDVIKLNLVHDFSSISYKVKNLEYDQIIRVLKVMLLLTVQRRAERRSYFSNN